MREKFEKLFGLLHDWKKNRENIRWIVRQGRPFAGHLALMLGVSILTLILSMAATIVGKYVVDWAVRDGEIAKYAFAMGAVTIATIAVSVLSQYISAYIAERLNFGLVARVFDTVQRGVWLKLSQFHTGDLMTRLTSDISTVSQGIINVVPNAIVLVLQLVMAFGVLFYYDHMLAVFALILGPVTALCMVGFREKYQLYQKRLREMESEYRAFMQERLENLTVLKAFQLEDQNSAYIAELRARRLRTVMSSTKVTMWLNGLLRFVFRLGYVAAFCWGAYRISTGSITYGTMTIFLSLVAQVQSPMGQFAYLVPQVYSMLISTGRIREISEIGTENYAPRAGNPARVGIDIENASFGYDSAPVLRNVSVRVAPGERIGIVGTSGVGKTTFIRLVMAIIPPQAGTARFYDGWGWTEEACPASRRFISYVPQGNTLISGSIRQNLLNGCKNATDAEMWNALENAEAAEFVRKLPEGLDAALGEHAGGLSEGQAQRVAIARALIRKKPLLILDEATSALDESTEARVLENISRSMEATCLIVTHRRSMLKYCNRVLEIDTGDTTLIDARAAGA